MKLHRYRNPTSNEYQNIHVKGLTYEQRNTVPSAPQLLQDIPLVNNFLSENMNNNKVEKPANNQRNNYKNKIIILLIKNTGISPPPPKNKSKSMRR